MEVLFELAKLAIVGLIAGLFSSYLANRDHRHRKWWEMRVAAYQSAIEALSDLVYYYDTHFNAEIRQRDISEEMNIKLKEIYERAFSTARRYAHSGAFLFSEEANSALEALLKNDHAESYFEHLDNKLYTVRNCLKRLVECSKSDLKLKPSPLEFLQ